MNALEAAIYTRLSGTAITSLLSGTAAIYNSLAPSEAAEPLLVFNLQASTRENLDPYTSDSYLYLVKAIGTAGLAQVGTIEAAVETALHDLPLTISGWSNIWCMKESQVRYVELDSSGKKFYHAGGVYRITLAK